MEHLTAIKLLKPQYMWKDKYIQHYGLHNTNLRDYLQDPSTLCEFKNRKTKAHTGQVIWAKSASSVGDPGSVPGSRRSPGSTTKKSCTLSCLAKHENDLLPAHETQCKS